jgi:hypothetical protein
MPSTWLCMLGVHYQECLFVCSLSTVHCFNDVFESFFFALHYYGGRRGVYSDGASVSWVMSIIVYIM